MAKLKIKIFLSLFLSFSIITTLNYFVKNPKDLTPHNFYQYIKKAGIKIAQSISSINIIKINNLITLDKKQKSLYDQNKDYKRNNFFIFPTLTPTLTNTSAPTPIQNNNKFDTKFKVTPTLSFLRNYPTLTSSPTEINSQIIPTKNIEPTTRPTSTPIPLPEPILSDKRPGRTLIEIFYEVQKRQCVPAALLMAFKTKETGERFKTGDISLYNTYGWWKNNNPCYGFGYYTQTGIIPPDSYNANGRCSRPLGDQSYDQKIMGILQISEQEQNAAYKYLKDIFLKNYDRRVFFDNAMIFAVITKNRIGNPPKDCVNWPDDVIKIAAAKHHGGGADTCSYYYSESGASGDYCQEILDLYKKYKSEM